MPKPATRSTKTNKSQGLKNRFSSLKKTNKLLALLFVLATVVVGIVIIVRAFAASSQGTYSNWFWSYTPAGGYYSLEHNVTINQADPAAKYFWSHQFKFFGGDGGYMGLQSMGNRVADGSQGKTAVFSIFSSGIEATPGNCVVEKAGFDGYQNSGSSCRIAYDWIQGRTYHLKTIISGSDSTGVWWTGSVTDNTTGVQTTIGRIKVPTTWKGIGDVSVMWTEYFGPQVDNCATLPYSKVTFGTPVVNGNKKPAGQTNVLGTTSGCNNSKITNVSGGVVQEAGSVLTVPSTSYKAVTPTNLLTAAYQFATCDQKVSKTDGTTACAIDSAHPTFVLRNITNVTSGKKLFCFKGVQSDKNAASMRFTVGNMTTGLIRSATKTVSDGKLFDNACVSTDGIFTNSNTENFARISTTSGNLLIYGGYTQ